MSDIVAAVTGAGKGGDARAASPSKRDFWRAVLLETVVSISGGKTTAHDATDPGPPASPKSADKSETAAKQAKESAAVREPSPDQWRGGDGVAKGAAAKPLQPPPGQNAARRLARASERGQLAPFER